MSDNEFEAEQQTGSHTFPQSAGDCKKGDFVLLNNRPCKVVDTSTNKTGKHGHAKTKLVAIDIFDGTKVEDVFPSTHGVDCPNVTRKDYELVSIDENNFITIIDEDGSYREDLKLPNKSDFHDYLDKLKQDYDNGMNLSLSIVSAMGTECVVGYKENKK